MHRGGDRPIAVDADHDAPALNSRPYPGQRGFGSSMPCWRRLAEWAEVGVWSRLHTALLVRLRSANALDFSRAAVDGSHIRAHTICGERQPLR